jgi:hypothetical protein
MAKTAGAVLGDIYDAWRAQDLDWLASYLPDEFCHVMHFPIDLHPSAGLRQGKKAAIERWRLFVESYDIVGFDTSDLVIEKNRAAVEIPSTIAIRRRARSSSPSRPISGRWRTVAGAVVAQQI